MLFWFGYTANCEVSNHCAKVRWLREMLKSLPLKKKLPLVVFAVK